MKYAESLDDILDGLSPSNMLIIGPVGQSLVGAYLSGHPQCQATIIEPDDIMPKLDGLGRYDLVFVSHVLETLPFEKGVQLVARLRDIHAKRLVLSVLTEGENSAADWRKTDFLSLGLVQLAENTSNNKKIHVFGYDVLNYKTNPDWLNSRYWAHPELYDKHWW